MVIAKVLSSKFGVGESSFRIEKSGYVDTVPFGVYKKKYLTKLDYLIKKLLRSEDNDINSRIMENGGKVFLSKDICSIYYFRDGIWPLLKQGLRNGNVLFRIIYVNRGAMGVRYLFRFYFYYLLFYYR